ncbi:MAG: hypothetical protein HZY74_02585 [Brevundimonas sp.]|nr:MAG: hypothetical protein HZY74_02585 [Brevundimonas sp.]
MAAISHRRARVGVRVKAPSRHPQPTSAAPSTPRGRHQAPDEIWAEVRADYLAGLSAPACCRRYGVGLTALRDRAAREGWRRRDQPWVAPNNLDIEDEGVQLEEEVDGDLDRVEPSHLAWVAHRRMLRAVMRGQATEALRWNRVEQVMLKHEAELERLIQQDEFCATTSNTITRTRTRPCRTARPTRTIRTIRTLRTVFHRPIAGP